MSRRAGGRDSESNLDHTLFRQYSSSLGRWMHPDPAGLAAADPSNPQSWNRYAYVLNDPMDWIDPLGLGPCPTISCVVDLGPAGPGGVGGGGGGGGGAGAGGNGCTFFGPGGRCGGGGSGHIPPPRPSAPTPNGESYADCVKNDGKYFSLQHGLQAISGGRLGDGLLASAFTGNDVSDLIALAQGEIGDFAKNKAVEEGVPVLVNGAASVVPDISISTTTATTLTMQSPTMSTSLSVIETTTRVLPFGTAARVGSKVLTGALEGFGKVVKLPFDLSVSSFSAVVCGIGR